MQTLSFKLSEKRAKKILESDQTKYEQGYLRAIYMQANPRLFVPILNRLKAEYGLFRKSRIKW